MKYKIMDKRVWSGSHDGVGFEIQNWATPPNSIEKFAKDNWTYYIFLHLDRIPEQYDPNTFWLAGRKSGRRIFYDYYEHPVIGGIFFHGGCTWYSKESGFDDSPRVIKIGCDYQDFKDRVSKYKYWCCGNGKLYDLEDGIFKNESFYSEEYYGDKDWFKEYKTTIEL